MSITPSITPSPENPEKPTSTNQASDTPSRLPMILLIVMCLGFGGLFFYASSLSNRLDQVKSSLENSLKTSSDSHGEALQKLASRLDQTDGRTAELEGQFTVTRQRLGLTEGELRRAQQIATQLAQQQKEAAEQLTGQLGQLQQEQVATKGSVGSLSSDVSGVRAEVKTTKEDLAATKSQLQRVVGDLGVQSDLVAHNRTELDELKLLGARDYVEFDLSKKKGRQRIGTIQLELKKTDEKKQKYTVNLVVDDKTIEKKDKNVYEPVQFYQEGYTAPTEMVVNQIQKDRIVGYVSVPKKKEARKPMANPS